MTAHPVFSIIADPRSPIVRRYFRKNSLNQPLPVPDPPSNAIPGPTLANRSRRDVLNLLECHACGYRVDMCEGKDRLQTLYSEWRVVLLCRKCLVGVESAVTCSYCFEGCGGDGEGSFRCGGCRRRVHKQCFFRYGGVAPWSYLCNGRREEFKVCIDCWVPKTVARFGKVRKRRGRKKEKKIGEGEEGGECRVVQDWGFVESGVLMEGIRGVDVEVKKNKNKKNMASGDALGEKPVVLAIGATGEFKKKRRNSFNMYREMCGDDSSEVDIVGYGNVLDSLQGNNADVLVRASAFADKGGNGNFELRAKMNVGDMESSVEEKVFSQSLADESATENSVEPKSGQRIDDCVTKIYGGCKYVDVGLPLEGEDSCSNGMGSECQCYWKRDERINQRDDEWSHLKTGRFAFKYQRRCQLPTRSMIRKPLQGRPVNLVDSKLGHHRIKKKKKKKNLACLSAKSQTVSSSLLPNVPPAQSFPSSRSSRKKPYSVYERKLLIAPSAILTDR